MNHPQKQLFVVAALLFALAGAAAAQPVIDSIQASERPHSGRVAITGSGFGSSGRVLVAGLDALTSTWTDTRIVAYVPEATPLGSAELFVSIGGQQSNSVFLTVTERAADGRVRWTFEADTANLWWRPALAPDGTLYLHASNGIDGVVYALSPDGALLWIQKVNWYPYVPPTAGPDGAVYVGSIQSVYRISPGGEIDWEFQDPTTTGIQVAPTIGPDGLLYGAFSPGIGAFAIDPATGQLVWSNPGDPLFFDNGSLGTEPIFGSSREGGPVDQFYAHVDGTFGSNLFAFGLGGDQRFRTDLAALTAHEPALDSAGTLYTPASIDLNVRAIDPDDGTVLWDYNGGFASGISEIEAGPDDTLYYVGNLGALEAFDPAMQLKLWRNDTLEVLSRPTITPDGSTLLVAGTPTFGQPGYLRAYDAADGAELWTVPLPGEPYPQSRLLGTHRARVTPEGTTAYWSTVRISPGSDPSAVLYALELDEAGGGIPCGDVRRLQARCTADGRLQARVTLSDTTYDGLTMTLEVDGIDRYEPTIVNGRASLNLPGQSGTGPRTLELVEPAGCFPVKQVVCN